FPPGPFGVGDLNPSQLRGSFSPENRFPQGLLSVESSKARNEHMFSTLPPKAGLPQHDMPGFPFARPGTCSSARPREGSRDAQLAGTGATGILLWRERAEWSAQSQKLAPVLVSSGDPLRAVGRGITDRRRARHHLGQEPPGRGAERQPPMGVAVGEP